jgi:hypothetical protein
MRRELINHQMTNSVAVERMRLIHRLKFQIQLVRRSPWPEKIKMADSHPVGKKNLHKRSDKTNPSNIAVSLILHLPTYLLKLKLHE